MSDERRLIGCSRGRNGRRPVCGPRRAWSWPREKHRMSHRMTVVSWSALLGAGMSLPLSLAARAEPLPQIPSHQVALRGYDSGPVEASADGEAVQVVYSTQVQVPGAAWVRLSFGDVALAGDP